MNKIDRRVSYKIMLDTETCNTRCEDGQMDMRDVLVYDIGWAVVDKRGKIYEEKSYIVKEIFMGERDLMKSAYYANKIPQYLMDIEKGTRKVATMYEIRKDLLETMKRYNAHTVVAHNSRFDLNALNGTYRWLTKSKHRYFFPYGTEVWDTMKMANDTICKQPTYKRFCERNGYVTKNGQVRKTAEILYRYIACQPNFVECHTGLEDVRIEAIILAKCFAQHKKMRKKLYENA